MGRQIKFSGKSVDNGAMRYVCRLMEGYARGIGAAGSMDALYNLAKEGDCQFSHLCPDLRECMIASQKFYVGNLPKSFLAAMKDVK